MQKHSTVRGKVHLENSKQFRSSGLQGLCEKMSRVRVCKAKEGPGCVYSAESEEEGEYLSLMRMSSTFNK